MAWAEPWGVGLIFAVSDWHCCAFAWLRAHRRCPCGRSVRPQAPMPLAGLQKSRKILHSRWLRPVTALILPTTWRC